MPDLFDNPLGLDGFEFLEFCAPEKGVLEPTFERMGFSQVARHRSKDVQLWRQGHINLVANYEPRSPAAYFAAEHGPSACGMGFRVRDAARAYALAIERGGEPVEITAGVMELHIPAIRGIGHSLIYLIDRYTDDLSIWDIDFVYEDGVERFPRGALGELLFAGLRFPRVSPVRRDGRILGPQHHGDDGARREDPHSAQ